MNLFKILHKILLSALLIWLWSTNVNAYDFSVTCYGTNGKCSMNGSFTLHKISNEHDAIPVPIASTGKRAATVMFMLARCPSGTSCTLVNTTPVYQKTIGMISKGLVPDWGTMGSYFLTANTLLSGTFSPNSGADQGEYWNGSNLCLSIAVSEGTSSWYLWGINYAYPINSVACSAPVNAVAADTCSATTPSINVAFGTLERSEISTVTGAENDKTQSFTLNCTGSSKHDFSLKLNMTPVSWSSSQITTSNTALGVTVSTGGVALNNGDTFTMSVPAGGSASTDLVFSALRNPSIPISSIATGDFTASATLIVTEL